MRPVVLSRASTGSPASPPALAGSRPPSVQVAPLSIERDQPVKWFAEVAIEAESLNPTTIVLPKETTLVSLCVKFAVPVDPVLLLISGLTLGKSDLGTSFAYSNPGRRYGPAKNSSGTIRTTADPCQG